MEKIVLKNLYLNIVIGSLLIILAFLGYFLDWFETFLPYFIGVILFLLSVKRFAYSYKKITSKNASLILALELVMDFVFAGLLFYFQSHVEVFIGLIVYIRGVSYLLINYVATRKINLLQYILNILYVTFGAFLVFYPMDSLNVLVIGLSVLLLLIGIIYLFAGISVLVETKKADAQAEKFASMNYDDKTLTELKEIAKERNIHGVSRFSKAELIAKLKGSKKD